jgi:hypothetical protein
MASNQLLISLSSAKLLPSSVIPNGFTPSVDLSVTFHTKKAENGSLLRVSDVKAAPTIAFSAPVSATFQKHTLEVTIIISYTRYLNIWLTLGFTYTVFEHIHSPPRRPGCTNTKRPQIRILASLGVIKHQIRRDD